MRFSVPNSRVLDWKWKRVLFVTCTENCCIIVNFITLSSYWIIRSNRIVFLIAFSNERERVFNRENEIYSYFTGKQITQTYSKCYRNHQLSELLDRHPLLEKSSTGRKTLVLFSFFYVFGKILEVFKNRVKEIHSCVPEYIENQP